MYCAMAESWHYTFDHRDDDDNNDDDNNDGDYDADETAPFLPGSASTPGPSGEEIQMKTMQKEKSGLPETSYVETSFGGRITDEDIERRLSALREDPTTGLLDTTKMDTTLDGVNPLSEADKAKQIQKVRDFIKARYPNADLTKPPIRF